jgi:hypothetical protein
MNDRVLGVGLSSSGLKALGFTAATAQMAAAGGVLGAVVGALTGGDTKAAGIGGAIGALVGGLFGAFGAYEAGQAVSQ